MKQLNILNMSQFQITNAIFHVLSSAPSSPLEGQYYYNSVSKGLEWHNGSTFISPLARANHTGSQLAATISDFTATVRANSLDQMTAPAADVAWNSKKITGLLDPTNAQDAATKNYVDIQVQSAAAGIDSKPSVRVVATSNIALTGLQTIDGVTLIAGDRVLAQNNTTASQNGVYVVASGAWTRATDADATGEITPGAFWFVEEGTTNNKTQWRCNNTGTVTLGSTAITIVQFGASSAYTASNGVNLTGSNFSAVVVASGGLTVGASGLSVDRTLVPNRFSTSVGDASATSIVVTHNLNTQDVVVTVREVASPFAVVMPDIEITSVNTITVKFGSAPTLNQYRVSVVG
jgi:phage-related tail fiber protein